MGLLKPHGRRNRASGGRALSQFQCERCECRGCLNSRCRAQHVPWHLDAIEVIDIGACAYSIIAAVIAELREVGIDLMPQLQTGALKAVQELSMNVRAG